MGKTYKLTEDDLKKIKDKEKLIKSGEIIKK
jgi:hypothetical protein